MQEAFTSLIVHNGLLYNFVWYYTKYLFDIKLIFN